MFGGIFSRLSFSGTKANNAKSQINPTEAITKLKDMIVELGKKEKHIYKKIENELEVAKENATKNKRALKKKHSLEAELEKISGTITTLESQVMTLENAHINLEIMEVMKAGSEAMKSIHGAMYCIFFIGRNADKVDSTMLGIQEQINIAAEISAAVSQPLGIILEANEDELETELAMLRQEKIDEKLLEIREAAPSERLFLPSFSKIPSSPLQPKQYRSVEDELESLRSSMSF